MDTDSGLLWSNGLPDRLLHEPSRKRESVEVMCHSVQGKKGDQYCELDFPKGTIQGDRLASLPADRDNRFVKVSSG